MATLLSDDFAGLANAALISSRVVNNANGGLGNRSWFTSGPALAGNGSGGLVSGGNAAAVAFVELGVPLVGYLRVRFDPAAATANAVLGLYSEVPTQNGVAAILANNHTSLIIRTFTGGVTNNVATLTITAPGAPFWLELAFNSARTGITAIVRNDNLSIRNQTTATLGAAAVGDIASFGFAQSGTDGVFDNFSVDHVDAPFYDDFRGTDGQLLSARGGLVASSIGSSEGFALNGSGGLKLLASNDTKIITRETGAVDHFVEVVLGANYASVTDVRAQFVVGALGGSNRGTGYAAQFNPIDSLWELWNQVGAGSRMSSVAGTWAAGDVMRLERTGTSLVLRKNGTSILTGTSAVDANTKAAIRVTNPSSATPADVFRSFEAGEISVPAVITGPTGAAGAASITLAALENQNAAGTWTATGSGAWSLSGTDAGLLSISGGVVTLASGSFDFEAKASYSFNVVRGSASQAVTLNITNVVEISAPTRSTPTATTAEPGFTTDIATGEARCVLIAATSPPATPSAAQVKAGQNAAGTTSGVVACTPLTITSTGAKAFAPATVTAGLSYYPFTVHTASGIDSAVLVGLPHYPGTGRAVADVSVSGWAATGAATLAAALNEDTSNRATFITGPAVSGSPSLATFDLSQPYPPGTYSVSIDADMVSGTGTARVKFFDAGGTLRGTGPDISLGTTAAVFTFNVTIAGGTATRFGIETQA